MNLDMADRKMKKSFWMGIPLWIIVGALIILVSIFVFWTLQDINKHKENATLLLLEKGAALIRSFEAGTRTGMMGMMGMHGGGFQLQNLLMETAKQLSIVYLAVTDVNGHILAHNDPTKIEKTHGRDLDLERIADSARVQGRQIPNPNGADTFEVFRRFSPAQVGFPGRHRRMMSNMMRRLQIKPQESASDTRLIIFVGLDMGPIEAARKQDTRHTIIMAIILLLIGVGGIVSLFLAQAYRTARTSLTRIKAFSDSVVENMPIGLLAIDGDGNIASFNQSAESVLRLSSREILGKKAKEVLPKQIWTLPDELETEKGVVAKEIDCPLEDGKVIPLDVSLSLLEGDDGTYWGYIILFRDMTEVQNLKNEIERSQRLASIGKLAAGIAHEIRNPLSSIKGFATYFGERYRSVPEDKKIAEIMVQEVDRLNRVIGQLLEFARPLAVEKKPTSLQGLIRHSLKMIEGEARTKKIEIKRNLSNHSKDVMVDPDRINQVLLNLFLNAVEAMEEGGRLDVDLSWDEVSQQAKIIISDTGVGIKKEDLVHVFDPYFTTKQSGTGLGLAIVHKIIESHRGEVRVESEAGRGTRVMIILPVAPSG